MASDRSAAACADLPAQSGDEHDALADARWVRAAFLAMQSAEADSLTAERQRIAAAIKRDAALSRCERYPGEPFLLPDYTVMESIAKWIEDGAKTR